MSGQRESFAARMADILNGQALGVALCLGYRAGLFEAMDRLARRAGPADSHTIAREAGMNERYVREWLAVMACGGIVELSACGDGRDLFLLPPGHGDVLCLRSGSGNLGVYTQELPLLTRCALDEVQEAFRTGGGVPYGRYPSFHDWMGRVADAKHRAVLVDVFLPGVADGEMVRRLEAGIDVLDVGCSEGVPVLLMAAAYPNSRFVGIDLCEEALETARREAGRLGLANARFESRDAALLADDPAWRGAFGYVTAFDAVHDQTRPLDALRGIKAVLAPGGLFSMVDIKAETGLAGNLSHPMGAFLYTVSLMHCLPVGLVDGGAGLGMMWGRQKAVSMLREAGFEDVDVRAIPSDGFNTHYLCR